MSVVEGSDVIEKKCCPDIPIAVRSVSLTFFLGVAMLKGFYDQVNDSYYSYTTIYWLTIIVTQLITN